jgi:hypothetical protein
MTQACPHCHFPLTVNKPGDFLLCVQCAAILRVDAHRVPSALEAKAALRRDPVLWQRMVMAQRALRP